MFLRPFYIQFRDPDPVYGGWFSLNYKEDWVWAADVVSALCIGEKRYGKGIRIKEVI